MANSKIVKVLQPDGKDAEFIEGAERQLAVFELADGRKVYAVLDYKKLGYIVTEKQNAKASN